MQLFCVICPDGPEIIKDNQRSKKDLEILKKNEIRFFVGTTEYDLYDSTQYFMIGMNVEVSEYFARDQAQKSILNRIERAKKGYPSCGKKPYGRTFNKEKKTWEIDEGKKKKLEEISRVYLEDNIGFEELGRRFGMNGSNLDKILTKRSGDTWEQRFRSKSHNIDVIVPTKIPRLLEEETIQKIKNKAKSRKSYNHGVYKYEYLFNRIIFDADTRHALTGTPNSKGKRYYKPYQGINAHRYMINADILEQAVLREFFAVLSTDNSLKKAVFNGNPVGKVAEELKERVEKLQKELGSIHKKIENCTKAIIDYEGEEVEVLLEKLKSEIRTLEQKKKDIEFQIQITKNQISTLPTDSEIETIKDRIKKSKLLTRQKENYFNSGNALENLSFLEKKKVILLFFGGRDEAGEKYGIYVKDLGGNPRKYGFKAYGRFGFVNGQLEARTTNFYSYSHSIDLPIGNNELYNQTAEIVLKEYPELKIKEEVYSINQNQAFLDTALLKTLFDLGGNIDKSPACWDQKPKLFPITIHFSSSSFS
jgi:site-specific DNA recombinase